LPTRPDLRSGDQGAAAGVTADDDSLVVHIAYGAVSFLLPGDITEQREAELAARVPAATVLLAGRNGAADATSAAWLEAVSPSAVVFSVKPDPRTVLPAPEVVARTIFYPVWRTDEQGAVEWVTEGAGLRVVADK
jgi:competence protein ComEC